MSAAMLTRADTSKARFLEASLEDALRAFSLFAMGECLVCGAVAEVTEEGRVACGACGSVLEAPAPRRDQLAIV